MFHVETNVPEVYVEESRDFQLFARLYDLVFQSVRYSIDSMENISNSMACSGDLLPLLGTKVGLFDTLQVSDDVYRKVLSAFPHIIRYKGSLKAVELVANLFERLVNTTVTIDEDENDHNKLTISFMSYSPDAVLLRTLLEYIRPAGLDIDYVVVQATDTAPSDFKNTDSVTISDIRETSNNLVNDTSAVGFTVITKGNNKQ